MRKQVEVVFPVEQAQALVLRLEGLEGRSDALTAAMLAVRAALNAPPTSDERCAEAEEKAGFDRSAVEAAICEIVGVYSFFESDDPGKLAFGETDFRVADKLSTAQAARKLADAAGYPLIEVETCDWSFSDRCDEEAISVSFALRPRDYVAEGVATCREHAETHGYSFTTPGTAATAVDAFEMEENFLALPTKVRDEIIAQLNAGA